MIFTCFINIHIININILTCTILHLFMQLSIKVVYFTKTGTFPIDDYQNHVML